MTSGCRLARAVYSAAVRPAGPDPMMMTLREWSHERLDDEAIGSTSPCSNQRCLSITFLKSSFGARPTT